MTSYLNQVVRKIEDLPKPDVRASSWYVLYVAPSIERRVAWDLVDRGYPVYVPSFVDVVKPRHAPKAIEVRKVVFPRYVFVGMRSQGSWWEVRCVQGVASVVSQNFEPLMLRHVDIEDIMAAQDMGLFSRELTLKIGERVALISGAFQGYEATITAVPRKPTGDIGVDLMGKTVHLPLAMIKRVTAY